MTLRELCEAQHRALLLAGCWCTHNVPYAGCKVPQVVKVQCSRCKCIGDYEVTFTGEKKPNES